MPANLQQSLNFLAELRANNTKAWFDENRRAYDTARAAFEDLVEDVLHRFSQIEDIGATSVKDCLFRINRDVRFSKDKTPYKTNFGAVVARSGRKQEGPGIYIGIEPGDSFLAGGAYMPMPEELQRIRQAIDEHPADLQSILANEEFKRYFGEMQGEKLKNAPKGYDPAHPAVDLLRHKQFYVSHPLSDTDLLSDTLADDIIDTYFAMKPFDTYFFNLRVPAGK